MSLQSAARQGEVHGERRREAKRAKGERETAYGEEVEGLFKVLFVIGLEGSCPSLEFSLERHLGR